MLMVVSHRQDPGPGYWDYLRFTPAAKYLDHAQGYSSPAPPQSADMVAFRLQARRPQMHSATPASIRFTGDAKAGARLQGRLFTEPQRGRLRRTVLAGILRRALGPALLRRSNYSHAGLSGDGHPPGWRAHSSGDLCAFWGGSIKPVAGVSFGPAGAGRRALDWLVLPAVSARPLQAQKSSYFRFRT